MEIEQILSELKEKLDKVNTLLELNDIRVNYLGKKGRISLLSSKISELPNEEKKTFGAMINNAKNEATNLIEEKKIYLEEKELNEKLEKEKIDISLPATNIEV